MTIDSPSHAAAQVSARALASRRNGARSRGPTTAAGKARSARNALQHGLCARTVLLDDEDADRLEAALLGRHLAHAGVGPASGCAGAAPAAADHAGPK